MYFVWVLLKEKVGLWVSKMVLFGIRSKLERLERLIALPNNIITTIIIKNPLTLTVIIIAAAVAETVIKFIRLVITRISK